MEVVRMSKSFKFELKTAFISTIPVLFGYLGLGIGFGILLRMKGYGVLWAFGMAVTMFAGSMQYVGVDVLAGGISLASAAVTTLLVNARHLFYGISLIEKYKNAGVKKLYLMFGLTDETYSLVCSDEKASQMEKPHRYYFMITLLDHCYWITGCVLGSLIGKAITFSVEGIDFVLTALFVTIFVDQWISNKNHLPAIVGVVVSVICLVIFGADNFLIPAMIGIFAVLTATRSWEARHHA